MTINLEKELLKQNKKIALPQELLLIQEYDRLSEFATDNTLERVGLNKTIKEGREIKNRIDKLKQETLAFPQDRVFHISQIEQMCKKYRLKFLRTKYYEGTIDSELPSKISSFEIATGVTCKESNTKIMAPMESFRLQKKPKDPLFFYQINKEYCYLIHKWGNDLNIFRRIYASLERPIFGLLLSALSVAFLIFTLSSLSYLDITDNIILYAILFIVILAFVGVLNMFLWIQKELRIIPKNQWDSYEY